MKFCMSELVASCASFCLLATIMPLPFVQLTSAVNIFLHYSSGVSYLKVLIRRRGYLLTYSLQTSNFRLQC